MSFFLYLIDFFLFTVKRRNGERIWRSCVTWGPEKRNRKATHMKGQNHAHTAEHGQQSIRRRGQRFVLVKKTGIGSFQQKKKKSFILSCFGHTHKSEECCRTRSSLTAKINDERYLHRTKFQNKKIKIVLQIKQE